jgi:hypothetical protein
LNNLRQKIVMDKSILLALAAVTSVSTIATVYYVSPVEDVRENTPAILVDARPADVVARIRGISLDRYVVHFYGENFRERDLVDHFFDLARTDISDTETIFDLKYRDELLMQFVVSVKPVKGSMSEIDVRAIAGENRFSADPNLHPYDIGLLQSVADFLATDYVSSIVKGHPLLTGKTLEKELIARFAQDEDSVRPTARRIERTFLAAYGDELRAEAEAYADNNYESAEFSDGDYAEADAAADVASAEAAADAAADAARAAVEGY